MLFSSGAYFIWFACPIFDYEDKDYGDFLTLLVGTMLQLPTDKPLKNDVVLSRVTLVETTVSEHPANPLNLYANAKGALQASADSAAAFASPALKQAYAIVEPSVKYIDASFDYIMLTESTYLGGYSLAQIMWLCSSFNYWFGCFILLLCLGGFLYFLFSGVGHAFNEKIFVFFKTNTFLPFTFLTNIDVTLSFIYFFLSLYFLELHLFFVYTYNLSSDSTLYQFNFLLSSFFFIFFLKSTKSVFDNGFLFTVSYGFNEFFFFSNVQPKAAISGQPQAKKALTFASFHLLSKFALKLLFFVFFFFSTFFVWFLRYLIQFVRLLVLFMIHTIFELVIISSDTVLTKYFLSSAFFFKYVFFIFFFTFSFLYLIIYLNLMFTLQVFIFYFFSEVFQSNFVTDLSSFIAAKTKKI